MNKETYYYCNYCGLTIAVKEKKNWVIGAKQIVPCCQCKREGLSSIMKEVFPEKEPVFPLRYNRYKRSYTAEIIYSSEKMKVHKKNMRTILKECQEYLIDDLKKEFPLGWQGYEKPWNRVHYIYGLPDDWGGTLNLFNRKNTEEEAGGFRIKEKEGFSPCDVSLYWTNFKLISCDYGLSFDNAISIAKGELKRCVRVCHNQVVRNEE